VKKSNRNSIKLAHNDLSKLSPDPIDFKGTQSSFYELKMLNENKNKFVNESAAVSGLRRPVYKKSTHIKVPPLMMI
jgi:hypothetical protein